MGDNLAPVNLGGHRAVNVAIGYEETCASTDDDSIWCWGLTSSPGMVPGLPNTSVKAMSAAQMAVYALYVDGTVSPLLPNGTTPVFANANIADISGASGGAVCAVLDDGTFVCSPPLYSSSNGKVTALGVAANSEVPCGLFADGSVRCPPAGEVCTSGIYWCASNGTIALGQGATSVTSGGDNFNCALLANGDIRCWGGVRGTVPLPWLGSGIAYTQSDGGITFGAWDSVDLGTRPSP